MSAAPAMTSPVLLTLPYRSFTMVEPCKWSVQMVAFHHSNKCLHWNVITTGIDIGGTAE